MQNVRKSVTEAIQGLQGLMKDNCYWCMVQDLPGHRVGSQPGKSMAYILLQSGALPFLKNFLRKHQSRQKKEKEKKKKKRFKKPHSPSFLPPS
jgi:hypothetical protein